MGTFAVFGAGGRVGSRIVAEAVRRGHDVVAVLRSPGQAPGARAAVGDVTDAGSVAAVARGCDAVITSVHSADFADGFHARAVAALAEGLGRAGVRRLVVVTTGSVLPVPPGVPFHDLDSFPAGYRGLSRAREHELRLLAGTDLDWVAVAGPPSVLADGDATGDYAVSTELEPYATPDGLSHDFPWQGPPLRAADLAHAALGEAEAPLHRHVLVGVAPRDP
ncbi:NAD(P)-dependent oxidoreductase [Actinokineospora pegani]|uniref:NAD(P)-dependent oxidoreductase n=1 Tax=Actinokineospora pegani TaxID=2654637 RepID=UPI0012EA1673|nr:NAD(P)H-binding protein [Actinokineospora pegani]